ncbi:MAG: ribosomal-processing cysteine protease Prp [Clostridia bacterium]|nr:ribosomal-processing cysteine protease Prp [Clostridia bacterium]
MTRVIIYSRAGSPAGFEISGHSGAGFAGADIVCAAVSSCAYMTANTVTEIIGANADIEVTDGFMRFVPDKNMAESYRDILNGFSLHLTELEKQYPNNLKVTFSEV